MSHSLFVPADLSVGARRAGTGERSMAEDTAPRVLIWDIEATYNIIAKFDLKDEWIQPQNILRERYIICAAWKLLGDRRVQTVSVLDDPARFRRDPYDDRHVVERLRQVLSQADIWVAHFGDGFDLPYLRGRMLHHGMAPLPPNPTIDTKKIAKKHFYLNAHRLDYLGGYLGLGRKLGVAPGLRLRVLRGDTRAIRTLLAYNKQDVRLLERVFRRLQPWIPDHLNRQLYGHGPGCPRCGSRRVSFQGYRRAQTRIYRRLQCQACGGWLRETKACRPAATHILL